MNREKHLRFGDVPDIDSSTVASEDDPLFDTNRYSGDEDRSQLSPDYVHTPFLDRGDSVERRSSKHRRRQHEWQPSSRYMDTESDIDETLNHPPDVSVVYAELQAISDKLKRESRILHDREAVLRERERRVLDCEESLKRITEEEVEKRWGHIQQEHATEVATLDQALKEKQRESKRLKESFDTLKEANDGLRLQLEELGGAHTRLEKQYSSVQARLVNLQRKHEIQSRQNSLESVTAKLRKTAPSSPGKENKSTGPKIIRPAPGTYDVLAVLLDWVSDSHLRSAVPSLSTKTLESSPSLQIAQEKCSKVLPALVDILRDFPSNNNRIYLPCLQFIYWSLLHLDSVQGSQKVSLTSTLRRLGEELYKPRVVRFTDAEAPSSPTRSDKPREAVFFRSPVLHIRFLSSLVILKTLSQVDHLAHVFDVLKSDIKNEQCKELFLYYQATPVVLAYFKPSKALLSDTIDVFLQMSIESLSLQGFLESCSNERWFQACSLVLRPSNQDAKVREKLSIVLQKLSKIRSNKKYFEVFSLTSTIQELLRTCGSENTFLALNLKSILYNLKSSEKGDNLRASAAVY